MALQVKSTKNLITADKLRLKVLIYSQPGLGKTTWAGTAPNPGFAACETGQGKGLLSVAGTEIDYCEPTTLQDFDEFCSGKIFADKDTLAVDSLTTMVNTFIKEAALKIPRMRGDSDKRRMGIPELDDYGIMAELTRRMLVKLISQDKHVIVTATERYKEPDPETGRGESITAPELPGQLMLGAPAMFDFVLRLRVRNKLKDPKDPKSRFAERYLLTQSAGDGSIVKCRANAKGLPLLDKEEVFDPVTGQGSFTNLLEKILKGYEK